VDSCDRLLRKYPDAGILLSGDYFKCHLRLSQLVKQPTRKANILDKTITNCENYFSKPSTLSPIGRSDHKFGSWSV
jgi:hypothetical protein